MRGLGRIFAHAFARRIAYVLAALVLAWVGIGRAHAQAGTHPSPVEAWAECTQHAALYPAGSAVCEDEPDLLRVAEYWVAGGGHSLNAQFRYAATCPAGFNTTTGQCNEPPNCAARDPLGSLYFKASGDMGTWPSNVCHNGCVYIKGDNIPVWWEVDGQSYVGVQGWTPNENTCTEPTPFEPPPPDDDSDGCSNGQDAFPTNANECKDSDGDGKGDNEDHSPNDPDDGADGEGEEDGDDEGDNKSSGGGDCAPSSRPSCTGDGIACNQLFQMWSMRCALPAKTTVTGSPEQCSGGYTCSGDAAQCAQIALLRKSACASQPSTGGNQPGDGNGNGQPDWTEGGKPGGPTDNGEDPENYGTKFGTEVGTDLLDTSDLFGGGSCPQLPSFQIMGVAIGGADLSIHWCTLVSIMRAVVLIMGAFIALRVLMGD